MAIPPIAWLVGCVFTWFQYDLFLSENAPDAPVFGYILPLLYYFMYMPDPTLPILYMQSTEIFSCVVSLVSLFTAINLSLPSRVLGRHGFGPFTPLQRYV